MSEKQHGQASNPWSYRVAVAKIPGDGQHITFTADEQQRAALARIGGLRNVAHAEAEFDLFHSRNGAVNVTGRVTARVGQDCVVTLEPVENDIDEDIEVIFAEPGTAAAATRPRADDEEEEPDPPEIIDNGMIDIGKLAADMFFLGIDPYPRKLDAVFEAEEESKDPERHPFAALKNLRTPPR